jgi:hypothetical protein
LIDEKLRTKPTSGYLRILKIIASFKGRNPAMLPCNEIRATLDALSALAQNPQCGTLAEAVHNAITLIFKKVHGIKFKTIDLSCTAMNETDLVILSRLNIHETIINEIISSAGEYKS